MSKVVLLFIAVMLMLTASSCKEPAQMISIEKRPKEISLAVIIPQTGPDAGIGLSARQGIEYAVDEINSIGGIKGTLLKAEFLDDSGEPGLTGRHVNSQGERSQVVAIIGGFEDNTAFAGGLHANRKKILFLTPAAGATGIVEMGPYVFRNRVSYSVNTSKIAEFLFTMEGKRNFAILHPNDNYGISVAEIFTRRVKELGGTIVARESYSAKSYEFFEAINKIKNTNPQVIFTPCYASELLGIAQIVYQSGTKATLAGIESWSDNGQLREGLDYLEGAIYTTSFYLDKQSKNVREFVNGYKKRYGLAPDSMAAHCVDAVRILAQCMYAVGFEREALKNELQNIRNFPGLTGLTAFNNSRDAEKQILFLAVDYGKIEKLQ